MDEQSPGACLTMDQWPVGSWMAALATLKQGGLFFGSYIDLGCADGHFGLGLWETGIVQDGGVINIDANPLYEPSLRRIQRAVGGHYRICAIAEKPGTIDMQTSSHPYWASAAAPGEEYWQTVNQQHGERVTVPCRTLDSLIEELAPEPPYILKLDIQGLEAQALRSGPRMLADTAVVVCEVLVRSFREINAVLEDAGFELFDLAEICRTDRQRLAWFYPVYLHRDYGHLNPSQVWSSDRNEEVRKAQDERRTWVLSTIDAILSRAGRDR
jgi:FkbM family methyltransferase